MSDQKKPATLTPHEHFRFVRIGEGRYNVVRELYAAPEKVEVIDRNVSLPVARGDVRRRTFAAIEEREAKGEM